MSGPIFEGPNVCVISRQRVIGNTNGSSVYLLSLCSALREKGFHVHLVCPSPSVFGRWPYLIMRPEMRVFRSIKIRGSLRLGRCFLALDPRIGLRAFLIIIARRLGITVLDKPAPYSIALPLTPLDSLYLEHHARPRADSAIIADYAYLTEGFQYIRSDVPTLVVMHDLISSRGPEFTPFGKISEDAELKMLARAHAVVAIQEQEAAVVRQKLPDRTVILAPLAIEPVPDVQLGNGEQVLFVASKAIANVDALRWFFDEVWPLVQRANPAATLLVAGEVCDLFRDPPAGVRLLGFVSDLAPLYAEAAVVISPLRGGSGLKIKLIEAMGQGKAIIGTTITLQGVEAVRSCLIVRDDAEGFAAGVSALLSDVKLRRRYAEAALAMVRERFSPQVCYADLIEFVLRHYRLVDPYHRSS